MDKQYKIGIFGSAVEADDRFQKIVEQITAILVKNNCIIVNGATTGVSRIATVMAHKLGGEVWGFSPGINKKQHLERTPNDDLSIYTKLEYIPANYQFRENELVCRKYRNVTSTATVDAGIVISGRWGTMNEFTNLNDMGKVIGVLTGTGGIADELPGLYQKIYKKTNAEVIFEKDPVELVKKILEVLGKRIY